MVVAHLILKEYTYKVPDITSWIVRAQKREWVELQILFDQYFEAADTPELGCVSLFRNGVHGLGVGTVVEGHQLVTVHHLEGLKVVRINSIRRRQYARLK